MALSHVAVGDQVQATVFNALIDQFNQTTISYSGTPLLGSYNSANPILTATFCGSGTSDGAGHVSIVLPGTASAVLAVVIGQQSGAAMPCLLSVLSATSTIVFLQTHTFAGASAATTAWGASVTTYWQS